MNSTSAHPEAHAEKPEGLRARKKARIRESIVSVAANLFARNGYGRVTMRQIAEQAQVAEQTLYNYFPTKQSLVFDRFDELEQTLVQALIVRGDQISLLDAYSKWLRGFLLGEAGRRAMSSPGGMPRLVVVNDDLKMQLLLFTHRTATMLTNELSTRQHLEEAATQMLCDALLSIFVRVTEGLGLATSAADLARIDAAAMRAIAALEPVCDAVMRPAH
jgi:AcrR family transcriptional regulator